MGLDWMLEQRKARVGEERVFEELLTQLRELRDGFDEAKEAELVAKLENVSISAMETIGAPRIGIDQEATEWFRKKHYEHHRKAIAERGEPVDSPCYMRPFEEVLKENYGKWVPALAKEKGGLAKVTGMLCGDCDFRGKWVGCSDVLQEIDPGLCDEAYNNHGPDECVEYAERIEQAVERYKNKHENWAFDKNAKNDIKTLHAAIEWLRFWGSRGFGYHAWY